MYTLEVEPVANYMKFCYYALVFMRQRHTVVGLCVILSFSMSVTLFS